MKGHNFIIQGEFADKADVLVERFKVWADSEDWTEEEIVGALQGMFSKDYSHLLTVLNTYIDVEKEA